MPSLDPTDFVLFLVTNPWHGLHLVLAFVGAMGACAYFPHLALGEGPRPRRFVAGLLSVVGIVWLLSAYIVAQQVESNVGFIYSHAFATLSGYGVVTVVLERRFGHPLFQHAGQMEPQPRDGAENTPPSSRIGSG